jgi:Tfp pilus assembly protein PilZ
MMEHMDTGKKIDGPEHRKAKRVYASFVEYCRAEDTSSKTYQAFVENVSALGVCMFVNEAITVGTVLSLTIFLLDGSAPITVQGKAVWARPSVFVTSKEKLHFDVGVEFTDISEEDRDRLMKYTLKYAHEIPPPEKRI